MNAERPHLTRRRAWNAARWALGIGVVALMVVGLDAAEVMARITAANGLLVVVAVLGLTAVHVLGATTWAILCRQLAGLRLGWASALRVYYAGQALGGVTPANLGGDAYRVVAVRNAGSGWGAAVAPVLVQRATSYLAVALLALPAIGLLAFGSHLSSAILPAATLLCGLAGGVGIVMLAAPSGLTRLLSRLSRTAEDADGAAMGTWARPPVRSMVTGTGLGLAFHGVSVLLTAVLIAAVDPSAVGAPVVAAIVVARLSLAVPILPSGLGANEAILALLFTGLGLAPQTALAGLLLGRVALVLTTLIGASILFFGRPQIPGSSEHRVARGAGVVTPR
ncbi:MAG: lysylphosphatidylglycerol synthase transmembrane domain-containing protein [Chloroflexota bacterium]